MAGLPSVALLSVTHELDSRPDNRTASQPPLLFYCSIVSHRPGQVLAGSSSLSSCSNSIWMYLKSYSFQQLLCGVLIVNSDRRCWHRQMKWTNGTEEFIDGAPLWPGRKPTDVHSTHSSFPHYDADVVARCGPGMEMKSIESVLQTQQRCSKCVKHRNQEDQWSRIVCASLTWQRETS